MKIKLFAGITFLCFSAFIQPASAQQQKIDPVLEVRRDFDAKLLEIQKGKLNTKFADTLSNFSLNFDYSIFDKPIKDLYEFSPLPSAQIEKAPNIKYPVFYGNIGINYPLNPHLDVYFQPNLPSNLSLTVYGKHNSYWGEVPLVNVNKKTTAKGENNVYAPSSQSSAGVDFGFNWGGGELGLTLGYSRNMYSFYGYNTPEDSEYYNPYEISFFTPGMTPIQRKYNLSFMKDSLSHTYDKLEGKFFVRSTNNRPNSLYYNLDLYYSRLCDKGNYQDYAINYDFNSIKNFNENYVKVQGDLGAKFAEFHKFLIGFKYETSNSVGTTSMERYDLEMRPHYTYRKERWSFDVGLNFDKYVIPGEESFDVYAKGNVTYEALKNRIWLYALLDGKNNFRSYQQAMSENPWITPNIDLRPSGEPIILKAGIKGQIKDRLSYHFYGGYTKYLKQMSMHYYSSIWIGPQNTFVTMYKDMQRYGFGGELFWKTPDFESGMSFEYNHYKNDTDSTKIYNIPPFELNTFARYNWRERVIFGASLHFKSKTPVLYHYNPYNKFCFKEDEYINASANLNLDITYVYNKKISIYLKLNNLLNTNELYQMYYAAPGRGIGIGATFKL